jgi:hypothetical protein
VPRLPVKWSTNKHLQQQQQENVIRSGVLLHVMVLSRA